MLTLLQFVFWPFTPNCQPYFQLLGLFSLDFLGSHHSLLADLFTVELLLMTQPLIKLPETLYPVPDLMQVWYLSKKLPKTLLALGEPLQILQLRLKLMEKTSFEVIQPISQLNISSFYLKIFLYFFGLVILFESILLFCSIPTVCASSSHPLIPLAAHLWVLIS